MTVINLVNAALIADALREEAERLEPYYVVDQKNRKHERWRNVHSSRTREALYARANQILEETA